MQLIKSIKYSLAVIVCLLISMMSGCIPNSCGKIKIENVDNFSVVLEKIEMGLEQLGYLRTTIYSVSQGKEVYILEEGGKIGKRFASDKFDVYVELDDGRHSGEVTLCEPKNEFSIEAKQRFQSLVQAMKDMFGEARIEFKVQ